MDKYYTAGEAISKLKIPKSTFYDLLKKGEIPEGVKVPLRRQALYRKSDIDKLVEERARYLDELKQAPGRLALMPPNREDLEQLRAIDLMVFHEATLISPEKQLERFKYNPEAILVLKDTRTNTILGGVTMSPLKQEVLEKLINLEIDETQIQPEDYQPYVTDHPQDCYVVGIITRPGRGEKFYAGRLLKAALGYLIGLLDKGTIIRRLYTVATTATGDKLARSLHLTPLPGATKTQYEEFRRPYVLDLEVKESPSKLVNRYLKQRQNLERRRKRYQKQAREERNQSD
jgi:predicted DNA-binding transcriptional regulator AlpA